MEYIEREKAQDGLDSIDWYHINDKGRLVPGGKSEMETYVPFKAVEEMLRRIPAADARPVVLCRDCKYCRRVDEFEYWCEGFCSPARLVRKDDFCSHGCKNE